MRYLCLTTLLLVSVGCSRKTDPDRAALEKQFEETMSGATLVGHFTRGDRPGLTEEKYTVQKVSKLAGDTWLFTARVQYGSRDVSVPIPLTVLWAGDTPVISLTDLNIPGLGAYTARVMIYRGEYAGTWRGKNIGGHLYGRITKEAPASQ